MKTLLLLWAAIAVSAFAQNQGGGITQPGAAIAVNASPNGNACSNSPNQAPAYIFNGTVYTCQSGTYQAVTGTSTGTLTGVTANTGLTGGGTTGNVPLALAMPTLSTIGGVQAVNTVAHQWLAYIDTSGVPHLTQPNYSDLAGTNPAAAGAALGATALQPSAIPAAGPVSSNGAGTSFRAATIPDYVSILPVTSALSYGNQTSNSIAATIAAGTSAGTPYPIEIPGNYATEVLPGESALGSSPPLNSNVIGSPSTTASNLFITRYRPGPYRVSTNCAAQVTVSNPYVCVNDSSNWYTPIAASQKRAYHQQIYAIQGGAVSYSSNTTFGSNDFVNELIQTNRWGESISNGLIVQSTITGRGDHLGLGVQNFCFGGADQGADQGCQAYQFSSSQGNADPTGPITAISGSAFTVSFNTNASIGYVGEGHELIDTNAANLVTGNVTAITSPGSSPTQLTVASATASTVYSTGITQATTTYNAQVTVTPTTYVVGSAFTTGMACVSDAKYQRVNITVSSGGNITFVSQWPITTAALISQGGYCGLDFNMTADNQTASQFASDTSIPTTERIVGTLRYVIPIVWSDSTHIYIYTFGAGNWFAFSGAKGVSQWSNPSAEAFTLFPAATIYSVEKDASGADTGSISGVVTVGPYISGDFATSDTVVSSSYFAQRTWLGQGLNYSYRPSFAQNNTITLQWHGLMPGSQNMISTWNATPVGFYLPSGGIFQAPDWASIAGEHINGLHFVNEPDGSFIAADSCHILSSAATCTGTLAITSLPDAAGIDKFGLDLTNSRYTLTASNSAYSYGFGPHLIAPALQRTVTAFLGNTATPTYNFGNTDLATSTLSVASVTPVPLSFTAGQQLGLKIAEDGTGGRTYNYPSNMKGFGPINTAANAVNILSGMTFDATNIYATGPTMDSAGNASVAGYYKTAVSTVSTLQTNSPCNSSSEGARSGVTDALSPSSLSTVTGGGAVHVPVYCNGTNWIVE